MGEPAPSNWRKYTLIAAVISLLACGVMVAALFMPWLGSESGPTFSGWGLYESQRDAGKNVLYFGNFFTNASGDPVAFFTGWATLIGTLWLAGSGIVLLVVSVLLRRKALASGVAVALLFVVMMAGIIPAGGNAISYLEGGPASSASLEYGLILLWAATIVGVVAPMLGALGVAQDRKNALMVPSPPTPSPS